MKRPAGSSGAEPGGGPTPCGRPSPDEAAARLAEIGSRFYGRGWVLGTSGNFSAVVSDVPLRLTITRSAAHKGALTRSEFLQVDDRGRPVGSAAGSPSAETRLHLEIVRLRGAGAVLHTHSVWSTILSDLHARDGGLAIEGYEMLKGLDGVTTHAHREWIPIVENDQDMDQLAGRIERALDRHPAAHAVLLHRHGLYTWGRSLGEAERHIEILEFLLEAVGRWTFRSIGESRR
jgi:methylthioribulose-1-phosphate dehydratase